jgi:hypothetical protein
MGRQECPFAMSRRVARWQRRETRRRIIAPAGIAMIASAVPRGRKLGRMFGDDGGGGGGDCGGSG